MGQFGTTPAIRMPDSHNAGDFGQFLIGAPHQYAITAEQLEDRTDGHMDIDIVRAGVVVICPVKVRGGGIYMGDMHALQGDGEIAGHTADVSGRRRRSADSFSGNGGFALPGAAIVGNGANACGVLSQNWGVQKLEESAPISFVGTGPDLNAATENRAAPPASWT